MISRGAKGKIRVLTVNYDKHDDGYIISGESGLYKGKMTPRPNKVITEGKVKRTTLEQTELEYNALIKKQLDKGYKLLERPLNEYDEQSLQELLGDAKTDANGFKKHMLAKQIDKVKPEYIEKRKWYISRKIDGRP